MTTDAIRKRRPATSHLLLYAIIAFFAVALAWAWATRLERTIHGEGRLVPSARLQVVSHLEGGIVAAIGVRAGDAVRPGQALLRLDDTLTGADVAASRAQLAALGARSDRLRAEVEGRAPGMGAGGVEGVVHASRLADLQRLTQEGAARTVSATRAVAEAQAAVETRRAALDAVQRQRAMIAPLVTRGLEPRMTLVQLDGEAARARTELAQAETSVARMRAAVTETQAGLARARQEWRAQAAGELASVDADLTMRRSTAPALADRLRRTVVRAPVAGRVNRVLVATTGSAVAPGAPLVEIVPDGGPSVFDVHVAPADIAFVHMGQRAQINLTAYESAVYGAIDGKVVGIAPDTVTDERSGQTFYVVRVAAGAPLRDAAGRPLPIGPGMTADVALLGDRRSVLDYLLTPISRLQRTAFRE